MVAGRLTPYPPGMGNVQTPRELSVETSNVFQVDPKTLAIKRLFSIRISMGLARRRRLSRSAMRCGSERIAVR